MAEGTRTRSLRNVRHQLISSLHCFILFSVVRPCGGFSQRCPDMNTHISTLDSSLLMDLD
jgi:hypothetical protein